MNALLIDRVIGRWMGADTRIAEVVYEGGGESAERWVHVDSLKKPVIRLSTALDLNDGTRTLLPVDEIAHLLPDRTGVFVVFLENKRSRVGFTSFCGSHNAAIFDANGTLRFQLKNPYGEHGSFRSVVRHCKGDGSVELAVRACPKDWPVCEEVYTIDGSTDDLSTQMPRWVRD
ncbi:hypothetical protein [Variovorax sp. LT1R16]|uniref:hypothetical protein n=1 Tax=Variovorax sp. LT1R16 TaxID=3443728 RepID=UPI003F4474E9